MQEHRRRAAVWHRHTVRPSADGGALGMSTRSLGILCRERVDAGPRAASGRRGTVGAAVKTRRPQVTIRGFRTFLGPRYVRRMIRGRSAGFGVAVCAVVLALTGCDGDAASQPTTPARSTSASGGSNVAGASPSMPSGSSSASSSRSPTAKSTVPVPAAARVNTAAGAAAFVRFYLRLVNEAWSTADPDLLRPHVEKGCKTCQNQIATAIDLHRTGQRYADNAGAIGPAVIAPESSRRHVIVELLYDQLAADILDRSGHVVDHIPAMKSQSQVAVTWGTAAWKVSEIKLVPLS